MNSKYLDSITMLHARIQRMEGNTDLVAIEGWHTDLDDKMFSHLLNDPELQTKKVLEICAGSGILAQFVQKKNRNYHATDLVESKGVIGMDAAKAISHFQHEILLAINPQPMSKWKKIAVANQYLTRAILRETLQTQKAEIWIVFNDKIFDGQFAKEKGFFDWLSELHWYQTEEIETDYCTLCKFKYGDEFKDFGYHVIDAENVKEKEETPSVVQSVVPYRKPTIDNFMFAYLQEELRAKKVLEICAVNYNFTTKMVTTNPQYKAAYNQSDGPLVNTDSFEYDILLAINPDMRVYNQQLMGVITQETYKEVKAEIWIVFPEIVLNTDVKEKDFFAVLEAMHWYIVENINGDHSFLFKLKHGIEFKDMDFSVEDLYEQ